MGKKKKLNIQWDDSDEQTETGFVACIRKKLNIESPDTRMTWCGDERYHKDWCFDSLRHARDFFSQGFAILPCSNCVKKAMKVEEKGDFYKH